MIAQPKVLLVGLKEVEDGKGSTLTELLEACKKLDVGIERTIAIAAIKRYVASGYLQWGSKTNLKLSGDLKAQDLEAIVDRVNLEIK